MANGSAVFVDTTIQIARFVHSPEMKRRIRERIRTYDVCVTGLLVRLEFKRRLLREAEYLLRKLQRLGSYAKLRRHIDDVLPRQQQRKRNICVEILDTYYENESDADRTDRLRLYLRSLITGGLREFDGLVDRVIPDSGLVCARRGIREVKKYSKYDFGPDNCDETEEPCGLAPFLEKHRTRLRAILGVLEALAPNDKTAELAIAEDFIRLFFRDPLSALRDQPCRKVGDLLIALESAEIPAFYTMNASESRHLTRALEQLLVVRPRNPESEDSFPGINETA